MYQVIAIIIEQGIDQVYILDYNLTLSDCLYALNTFIDSSIFVDGVHLACERDS